MTPGGSPFDKVRSSQVQSNAESSGVTGSSSASRLRCLCNTPVVCVLIVCPWASSIGDTGIFMIREVSKGRSKGPREQKSEENEEGECMCGDSYVLALTVAYVSVSRSIVCLFVASFGLQVACLSRVE